jgi:hypothetical protein
MMDFGRDSVQMTVCSEKIFSVATFPEGSDWQFHFSKLKCGNTKEWEYIFTCYLSTLSLINLKS